jgi:hypothetical protein
MAVIKTAHLFRRWRASKLRAYEDGLRLRVARTEVGYVTLTQGSRMNAGPAAGAHA